MLFITKRKHNKILKEEQRKYVSLGFDCGYKTCQSDNGSKGFITGIIDEYGDWPHSHKETLDFVVRMQLNDILRDKEV